MTRPRGWHRSTTTAALLLAAAVCVSCARRERAQALTVPAHLEDLVPSDIQAAIRGAAVVEAVLVNSHGRGVPVSGAHQVHATSDPLPLDPRQAGSLRTILLDRRSWNLDRAPCLFDANVDYRFIGDDTVHVVVCHGCDTIDIQREGQDFGGGNVWRVAVQLENLSHALFPRDSVVTKEWESGRKNLTVFAP